MAGEAKTTQFAVGTATIMLGQMSDLMNLNAAAHSVGLAKNIVVTVDNTFLDLTQGVRNQLVYQVMTGQTTRVTAEVYEYTAKNLAYGLGLDGTALAAQTANTTLAANINANANLAQLANATGFAQNDWLILQPDASSDEIQVRKISSLASSNATLSANVPILVPTGSLVKKVNLINVAGPDLPAFLSMKLVGNLADGTPIAMLFPKIRVTKGFTVGFQTDNYGNLPFEIAAFAQVPSDPNYALTKAQALLAAP